MQACQGTGIGATALLNNTYVTCNLIRGVPKRVNHGPVTIFDAASQWSAPLYTCASSVKATIKDVTFFHNGTTKNIDNLTVRKIEDKKYSRKEDMPLWGVEDWFFTLTDYNPVWGLVDDAYEGFQNVSTVRQPSFYFLGNPNYAGSLGLGTLTPGNTMENIPAGVAPLAALGSVTLSSITSDDPPEYIGHNSLSLWLKWKELSASVKTVPRIISLVWTDYAASAMVGSKGVLGARNAHPDQAASINILPTVHRVGYHYAFGIPAYILLLCVIICVLMVLGSVLTGQSSIKLVDQRLKQTSIGRVLTTMFYPDTSTFDMKGVEWSNNNGNRQLDLGVGPPMPTGDMKPPVSASSDQSGVYTAVPQMQHSSGYEYPMEHVQLIPPRKALP